MKKQVEFEEEKNETSMLNVRVYTNILRQNFITSIPFKTKCKEKILPFIVIDVGYGENSKRLQKPVIPNLYVINQRVPSASETAVVPSTHLSLSGMSVKAALSKSNLTLSQIREASAERLPTPESQLSFKEVTPNAPKLPSTLQMTRSKPLS